MCLIVLPFLVRFFSLLLQAFFLQSHGDLVFVCQTFLLKFLYQLCVRSDTIRCIASLSGSVDTNFELLKRAQSKNSTILNIHKNVSSPVCVAILTNSLQAGSEGKSEG